MEKSPVLKNSMNIVRIQGIYFSSFHYLELLATAVLAASLILTKDFLYPGTEPLIRVMIEGKDQKVIEKEARALADLIMEVMI